ncbi:MAG: AbrB/MazE/SpoVT family DNA-binding domain-containing protein [Deltaproteobacteria bacterium]|nr:AbrB/MazE/SpoVT family DNA-binding domain-containing protein [Deltaproteobacteria bacterium]
MEARVQKWGHSLALRIPSTFAKKSKIQQGSRVDLAEVKGKLVITPLEAEGTALEMLLAGVTADNLHHEVTTGDAIGNEAW